MVLHLLVGKADQANSSFLILLSGSIFIWSFKIHTLKQKMIFVLGYTFFLASYAAIYVAVQYNI